MTAYTYLLILNLQKLCVYAIKNVQYALAHVQYYDDHVNARMLHIPGPGQRSIIRQAQASKLRSLIAISQRIMISQSSVLAIYLQSFRLTKNPSLSLLIIESSVEHCSDKQIMP